MLERLKNVSSRFFKSQLFNKKASTYFLFFIISFSFWFLSMLSQKHETTLDIPISFTNFPAELVLPQSPPDKVSVRIKAPGFSIIFYNLFNFSTLNLDVSVANSKPLQDGKEIFWLMNSKRKKVADVLGSAIEILDVSPSRLSISFKNKAKKRVPIILQKKITLKGEYWFSKPIQLLPDSITIYGQQLQLDSIEQLLTKELSIANLSDNKKLSIHLNKIDGIQSKISKVEVIISVESFVEEKIIKPIGVKNLKKGYAVKFFPKSVAVTVRAPKNKYLILQTDFFNIEVDANQMSLQNNTLDVIVNNLPSYIKLQMVYPERVEYLLIKD